MMPTKIIKYQERLGDILRCLPAAKYLSEQGNNVLFDCFEKYHDVFELVSYARPLKEIPWDAEILDLQIWPNKYAEYRRSRKTWTDFVYSHQAIKDANKTEIILDCLGASRAFGLPENYHLIAPFGISQSHKRNPLEMIQDSVKTLGKDNIVVLCPPEIVIQGLQTYTAPSVEQMAKAIRDADEFWAINSAPIILASAVRREKESKFWGQKEPFETDNVFWFEGLVSMD